LLRRAGTTEADDGDRGCSDSGEDRDGAAQCVARLVSRRPKGGPGRVVCPESKCSLGLASGCSVAAAGTWVLPSRWLGYDHTRVCKLTGVTTRPGKYRTIA
jgi:hypothetical protein